MKPSSVLAPALRWSWCLLFWGALLPGVQAATVQVSVRDADGKPAGGAVVFLESREAAQLVRPVEGAEVSQENKAFLPEVLVVTRGTSVQFPNHDTVRHHVYSFSPTKKFDLKLYAGKPANPVVFDREGIAVLGCNIHDEMVAWVVVLNTPYFARSRADGSVSLPSVPAGSYRLRAWHKNMPVGAAATDQALSLPEGGASATVNLGRLAP